MLFPRAALLLLLIVALAHPAAEGGNISAANLTITNDSILWGAIVGNLNGTSVTDPAAAISFQEVASSKVYQNSPNGSYAVLANSSLVLTRLPYRPDPADLVTPTAADFLPGGMFSNFTAFASLNYSSTPENPYDTVYPFPVAVCPVGGRAIPCPYITTNPDKRMGILKYVNGSTIEPVFVEFIREGTGYNGSDFQFQFMVPDSEGYYFYAYPNAPPQVRIITPQNRVYPTGSIPMTYNITDTTGISICWYVLDGTAHNMSSCTLPVQLSVAKGTHTLALYAADAIGLVSSDSVTFYVRPQTIAPPQGAGGTHIPYWNSTPSIPPQVSFTITPEILVTVDYPKEGLAFFTISSNVPVDDISCQLSGDFAQYSRVEFDNPSIAPNSSLSAWLIVDMTPEEILDYNGSMTDLLQCYGTYNQTQLSTTSALVDLVLNKPALSMENQTYVIIPGQTLNETGAIENTGSGNATTINMSAQAQSYPIFVDILSFPYTLAHGENGSVVFSITAPAGMALGTYSAPIIFYEYGRPIGSSTVILSVVQGMGPTIPRPYICLAPDLTWTISILLAGLCASVIIFIKSIPERKQGGKQGNTGGGKADG